MSEFDMYILWGCSIINTIVLIVIVIWVRKIAIHLGWKKPNEVSNARRFICPACLEELEIEEHEKAGDSTICPYCKKTITIPKIK